MNPEVEIILGPARSGKTGRMLGRYAQLVRGGDGGRALFLLPTAIAVDQVKRRLVAGGGVDGLVNPHIVEFYGLVNSIIGRNLRDAREISPAEQHAILERILGELNRSGALSSLAPSLRFPGFGTSLQNLISDLKKATVEPERLLSEYPSAGKEREVALIYERYQRFLTAHSLYDSQGKLWHASHLIRQNKVAPFQDVSEILVDGFADYTPAEFDILRALGGRCERMTFTLTCETGARRSELFESTLQTLKLICDNFKGARIVRVDAAPCASPLDSLENRIFDDAASGAEKCGGAIEIRGFPSRTAEVTEIGRRIKEMIARDGRSPAEIAVLARNLADYEMLFSEIFAEQGIPFFIHGKRALSRVPGLRPLMQLAELPLGNYARDDVCRFIKAAQETAPDFRQMENPGEVLDICARAAGVIEGRAAWIERLERHRARLNAGLGAEDGDVVEEAQERQKELQLAEKAVDIAAKFFDGFEELERPKSLPAHSRTILKMLERFGLFEIPAAEGGAEEAAQFHAETSRALETLSSELKKISQLPEESGAEINYERFIAQFNAILGTPIERTPGDRTCRVTVADVSTARNASFPIVFIPGMSEGEFPRPVLQNAFLDDAERNRLKTGGGPALQESSEELKKEMPLFYNAVTRAREKLVLTYPALDATGQEVGCSWYLDEIKKRFDDVKIVVEKIGSATLPLESAATRREAAVAAVSEAMRPDEARGEAALPPFIDASSLAGKIALAEERDSLGDFGRYDGVLDDPRAIELLRAELEEMVFSAGRIGDYLKCPFNYFCKRVLKLEELPEPTPEMHPMELGQHYHRIIRRFYAARAAREGEAAAVTPENLDEARTELSAICKEYLDSLEKKGAVGSPVIFAVERGQIVKRLLALIEYESAKFESRPAHFEWAFGFEKFLPDWDAASVHETLDIVCGGFTARMRGVIDRIDISEDGEIIIDYKSSTTPVLKDIVAGREIQLPLYAMAAEILLPEGGGKTAEAFFVSIRRAKAEKSLKRKGEKDELADAIEAAKESIAESLDGIAAGEFPPDPPKECYAYCPCKTACKYEVRRNRKKRERDS